MVLESLNKKGYCISNVFDLGVESLFAQNKQYLENLVGREEIGHRSDRLLKHNPIRDRKKFYELQNKQLLGRSLGLEDGSIIQFYLNNVFLDLAEKYLQVDNVKMRNCLVMYHPQNPFPPSASQNWHRDQEDTNTFKVFVYYNDVSRENGALWYVKESSYGKRNSHIWPNMHGGAANLNQSAVASIPKEDIVCMEGKAGTVCFFDSNGFHKGGRVTKGQRIATHACYLRPDAPHIKNSILPTFEYDTEEINFVDKKSDVYLSLSDRKRGVIE